MSALTSYSATFKMYDGNADVTTGFGTFYSVANQIGCTVAINPDTGVYTVSSVDQDNATATFRALYLGISIYKDFSIAKSRETAGPGTAKLITLSTTHNTFPYDDRNQPVAQSATLTVNKFNTSAAVTWRLRKVDATLIAEGTAASLVSGGYATSTANANSLTINQLAFDALCKTHGTNAVMVEAECTEGSLVLADRVTLFQLVQRSKVTWEAILDPSGAKAQTVSNAYQGLKDSGLVFLDLQQQAIDKIRAIAQQKLALLQFESDALDRFTVEQTQRNALTARVSDAEGSILNEQTVRAGETAALFLARDQMLARINNVGGGKTIETAYSETVTGIADANSARIQLATDIATRLDNAGGTGVSAETKLASLTTAITDANGARIQLATDITARLDNAGGSGVSAEAKLGSLTTGLADANSARAQLGNDISTRLNNSGGTGVTLENKFISLTTLISDETSNRVSSITSLTSRLNNAGGTGTSVEAAITSLRTADTDETSARAAAINGLNARFNNYRGTGQTIEAATVAISQAIIDETAARSTHVNGVQTTLNGQITGVQTQLDTTNSVLDGIKNRWTVTLNAGGNAVAGLILANGSNSKSYFGVQADQFYVLDSTGSGSAPFKIVGGVTYIKDANIENASITNLKLQDGAVDMWKLAANSATVTAGNYTDSNISLSPTQNVYTTVQSTSISTSGAPVLVGISFNCLSGTGSVQVIKFQILRDGNVIYDSRADQAQNGYGTPKNATMIDYGAAGGSHTYTLNLTHPTLTYPSGAVASNRSLWAVEIKR